MVFFYGRRCPGGTCPRGKCLDTGATAAVVAVGESAIAMIRDSVVLGNRESFYLLLISTEQLNVK